MPAMMMKKFGKFEVLEKLGAGGFGTVYRCRDPDLKREVAIKSCHASDPEIRKRFLREAQIASCLEHATIVKIHHRKDSDDGPFLVMEYLKGQDLAKWISRTDFSVPEKISVLKQVAEGLAYAHKEGVIHRDVKPSNIQRLPDGNIKILDFGLAKAIYSETPMTADGTRMGTVPYLAPEILAGGEASVSSDIFGFGVLAFELIALLRPFAPEDNRALSYQIVNSPTPDLRGIAPECPLRLQRIIERCLEKNPMDRYRSMEEVVSALETVGSASSVGSTSTTLGIDHPALAVEDPLDQSQTWRRPVETKPLPVSGPIPRARPPLFVWTALLLLSVLGIAWWWNSDTPPVSDGSHIETPPHPGPDLSRGPPPELVPVDSVGSQFVERIRRSVPKSPWDPNIQAVSPRESGYSQGVSWAAFDLDALLRFKVESERDTHLIVFFVEGDGDVVLVYPSFDRKAFSIPGKTVRRIPVEGQKGLELRAAEAGIDYFVVLAGPFNTELPDGTSESGVTHFPRIEGSGDPADLFIRWIETITATGEWASAILELRQGDVKSP